VLLSVMVAPATIALLASVTRPRRLPLMLTCANAVKLKTRRLRNKTASTRHFIGKPLLGRMMIGLINEGGMLAEARQGGDRNSMNGLNPQVSGLKAEVSNEHRVVWRLNARQRSSSAFLSA
jgi:hypothetical protein